MKTFTTIWSVFCAFPAIGALLRQPLFAGLVITVGWLALWAIVLGMVYGVTYSLRKMGGSEAAARRYP